jgi:hypothetical protein
MSISPAHLDASPDRPLSENTHDVMCLMKRHTYELAFAVPRSPQALTCGAQPRVYVRIKTPCHAGRLSLDLVDVAQFYEDLLQTLEYMQSEGQKPGASPHLGARSHQHTPVARSAVDGP